MREKNLLIWTTAIMMGLSMSCKKDKDESKTDILTSGQWKISAYTISPPVDIDGDGNPDSDVYVFLEACEKDNFVIFKKDGTLEANEGSTKCNSSDPQSESGSWSFVNEEKEIIIDGEQGTIQELTQSTFRIRFSFLGDTEEITFTR